jgi:hypothetical protein
MSMCFEYQSAKKITIFNNYWASTKGAKQKMVIHNTKCGHYIPVSNKVRVCNDTA